MSNLKRMHKAIERIIELDEKFVEEQAPSHAKWLQDEGYFDAEKPWDFLIALGIMAWSIREDYYLADDQEVEQRRKIWHEYRKPLRTIWRCLLWHPRWAMAAFTAENLERFEKVAGQKLPMFDTWNFVIHDSSEGDPAKEYLDFLNWKFIKSWGAEPFSLEQYEDDSITILGIRNLIASMERPPRMVLKKAESRVTRDITLLTSTMVLEFSKTMQKPFTELERMGSEPCTELMPAEVMTEAKAILARLTKDDKPKETQAATRTKEAAPSNLAAE